MAASAYEFVSRELEYEFTLTRWSFYVSVLSYLGAVTLRVLIQFELLVKKRFRNALLLISTVSGLSLHLISAINGNLYYSSDLLALTYQVMRMYLKRVFVDGRLLELLSLLCFIVSGFLSVQLSLQTIFSSKHQGRHDEDPSSKEG